MTVDTVVPPYRAFNERSGFGTPFKPGVANIADILAHPSWLAGVMGRYMLARGLPRLENHPGEPKRSVLQSSQPATRLNPTLNWDDIRTLKKAWPGKLIVKGILRADDAVRAIECGADGVVVSNHGARNLDGAVASIDALPAIAAAIGATGKILLDSGIRHGGDIAKALALGAEAVLVGRPALYGIATAGRAGAVRALGLLRREFDVVLAYLGCHSPAELDPGLLWRASPTASATTGAP